MRTDSLLGLAVSKCPTLGFCLISFRTEWMGHLDVYSASLTHPVRRPQCPGRLDQSKNRRHPHCNSSVRRTVRRSYEQESLSTSVKECRFSFSRVPLFI